MLQFYRLTVAVSLPVFLPWKVQAEDTAYPFNDHDQLTDNPILPTS